MQTIYTDMTISMSEFKKNPAAVLRQANSRPVAVLNHNKAAFYLVEPTLFKQMNEKLTATPKPETAWQQGAADRRRALGVLKA